MKKITTILAMLLIAVLTITAQPPQAFKYKAIARNKYGMLIINQTVAIRISLLQGSETGSAVFVETHTPASNLFGVIELEIGRGTPVSGAFSDIDWGSSDYYIKIEMDPRNKPVKDYTVIGTSQLLSVPYALYAGHVRNSEDNDADPFNELITNAYLSGTILSLQEGGTTTLIDLSGLQDGTEDADADPENEIQDLQLVDNILTITKNGTATEIDLSVYLDDTDTDLNEAEVDAMVENNGYLKGVTWADIPDVPADLADGDDNTQLSETEVDAMVANNGYLTSEADGDVTNEIQDINLFGHMLSISGGNTVQLPDSVNDADHDPFNELQELALSGTELTIAGKNTVDLAVLQDGVNDADFDPTNELQVLSIGHDTIYLSGGGYVKLPASMGFSGDYNDLLNKPIIDGSETKVLAGTNVTISGEGNEGNPYVINSEEGGSTIPGDNPGDMLYWNGSAWVVVVSTTNEGAALQMISGVPTWVGGAPPALSVTNPTTGETWMDRNLGAYQVATTSTDANAYGDLYQWGRTTDGHQKRTSRTTSTLSSSDTPGHGDFITNYNSPSDWRDPANGNLWQGVNGNNNPCPSGYRLPTTAEWDAERTSWSSNNAAGAFASPLKLPVAGWRFNGDGSLFHVGSIGNYWSSTFGSIGCNYLSFASCCANVHSDSRTNGFSVRCIKE